MTSLGNRLLAALFGTALLATPALAQQGTATISGRVTDAERGEPLAEARVIVTGTNQFASTGTDGRYVIRNVPAGAVTVRVIRVGFQEQRRPLTISEGEAVTADFRMAITVVQLSEVVTTATGETQRRRESGASIASIDSSQLKLAAVPNLSAVLTSRASGVTVQSATGTTGGSSRIRIRGSNSISLDNEPLLVIDGVRVNNSSASQAIGVGGQTSSRFNDINPEEIESIDIIKGPTAAALYGTAAANGVIQVTTKKGRSGRTRWDAFVEGGTLSDQNTYPSNYRQFGTILSATGVPTTSLTSNCNIDQQARRTCRPDSLLVNNPIEKTKPLIDGSRRNIGLSASGGSDNVSYFLSGEVEQEQGVYEINRLRRNNLRSNVRGQLTRTLDATLSVGYVNSNLRKPQNDNNIFGAIGGGLLGYAWDCGPKRSYPLLCGTVDTTSRGYASGLPPQVFYAMDTRERLGRLTGSLNSNWQALSWLSFSGIVGADLARRDEAETLPPEKVTYSTFYRDGYKQVANADVRTYTANFTGTATHDLRDDLRSTSSIGVQYNEEDFQRVDAFGSKLLAGTTSLGGTNALFSVNETNSLNRTIGLIGRQQFSLADRLFLTAAVRTDRNSAFGQNFGWIAYPAVNASWVVSEEPFFPALSALSSLRLRAGMGVSGQRPSFRDALQYFTPVAVTVSGADVPGFTFGNIGNPNLTPEVSRELEGGFDLAMLDNRLNFEYSAYTKTTKDALVQVPLAPSIGVSASQWQNLGKVRNWGHELSMRANVLDQQWVGVNLTANVSATRNELVDLGKDVAGKDLPPVFLGFASTQRFQEGYPLGAYFARPYSYNNKNGDNIISRVNCVDPVLGAVNPQPTVTGGPECELTLGDTSAAASFVGSPFPKFELNFTPAIRIGEYVQLQALIDHRGGQKLLNYTRSFRCTSAFQNCQDVSDPANTSLEDQAKAVAFYSGATYRGYIEDASFTKLREVSATLRLPQRFAARMNAASASLTLAGRNLATWTSYTGLDPEVNANAGANFSTSDFLTQPQVRYFTARLGLTF